MLTHALKWFIDIASDIATSHLIECHIQNEIETLPASASRRVEEDDILSGEYIRPTLVQPDVWISNYAQLAGIVRSYKNSSPCPNSAELKE